jgi:uncharacterized protein (TIGR03663 family)
MRWLDWASFDKRLKLTWLLIFVVAGGGVGGPPPRLSNEAVHAEIFRTIVESGAYRYDPHEYHGPTLHYFTLIPAWLSSTRQYSQVTEGTLRIVPVVFSILLILMTVLIADGLGPAAVLAAVLAALSPAMFFYSRYYIQETLLVCFTFGLIICGYRYVRTRALPWAIAAGVFAGLMHATKETAIIAFGSMGLSLVVIVLVQLRSARKSWAGVKLLHIILGILAAAVVSAVFYSSLFRYPRGVLDSYLAYGSYFSRAAGESTAHVHPWYHYLQMLLFIKYGNGPIWTEGWIVLLALIGMTEAVKSEWRGPIDPRLVRFIALYTLAMTIVYSAVPYKTPWCLLGFLHGMILLAGVGGYVLWRWARCPVLRGAVAVLLIVAAGHLAFEAYRANWVYYADSRNPYVYAHPTTEVFTAVEKVREYAGLSNPDYPGGVPVQIVAPGNDYWPLPWYLRSFKLGCYSSIPEPNEIGPLILVSSSLESALAHRLYVEMPPERRRMYMYLFDSPYYIWLRPQVGLMGFVRKDLWEQRNYRQSDPAELLRDKGGR